MQITRTLPLLGLVCASAVAQNCIGYGLTAQPANNLGLGDDAVATVTLPFSFPFNGASYNAITVSSNGFLWIGPNNGASQLTESESLMLSGTPRIAVCWDDLNPSPTTGSGGVYVKTDANLCSVSWYGVQRYANPAALANCECVIEPSGAITLHYESSCTMSSGGSQIIVGLSQGTPGAVASQVDLSTSPNITAATGYEIFAAGTFDLAGTTLTFVPTGPTDYVTVSSPLPPCPFAGAAAYGQGCPEPGDAFYELFPVSTFDLSNTSWRFVATGPSSYVLTPGPGWDASFTSADVIGPLQDDDTINVSMASMGVFPFQGAPLTAVDLCSNGYVWMEPNTLADYSASEAEFCSEGPRVAPCWFDLAPTLLGTAYGNVYWTATATSCMATWENVPVYNLPATQNTLQVKFHNNGDIDFSYLTVANNATLASEAIVGISAGHVPVPGSIDFGASIAANLNVSNVPSLLQTALTAPILGTTYSVEVTNIPVGTAIGVIILGLGQLNVDLTFLGATNCFQYATNDAASVFILGGATIMTNNLGLPNNPAFAGINLYSQGATFSAGLNPLGIITSNGIRGQIGM